MVLTSMTVKSMACVGSVRHLNSGKRLFIAPQTRPLHANEGNLTTRKGTNP
jgi:hypothetical protein